MNPYALIPMTGLRLCGGTVLVLERDGQDGSGAAAYRVQFPCGHVETRSGGSLRHAERMGKTLFCKQCSAGRKRGMT